MGSYGDVDALSDVAKKSIVRAGHDRAVYVSGKVASVSRAYAAFSFYKSAADTYTNTTAGLMYNGVWLEFNYKTTSTFGSFDIDTVYTATEDLELFNPWNSPNECTWWAACDDLGSTYYGCQNLQHSASGKLALYDQTSDQIVCQIAPEYTYSESDVFVLCSRR